ncbi:MAG: histidinol-phosphate transaminase [Thermodesulfovibrionia bacterium]
MPYVPGKPIEELERELGLKGAIKLASNENPLGPSPLTIKAMKNGLKGINRYPDGGCFYLREAISKRLGISGDEIIFGNGSNEVIELAVRTFLMPEDEAIMAHPSFIVYSMIVQSAGGKGIIVPLKDWRHDLDRMASMINERTKLIFIANPNNPTGTINTKDEMDPFIEGIPDGVLVVIDEAYHEYVTSKDYPDTMRYIRDGKDVLILRTFSKIYGLAGLRIGYGMAKADIINEMNKVRQPFNINTLAQLASISALEDDVHIIKSKEVNEKGKRFLYEEFNSMGVDFLPTEANFIYILLKRENARLLYNELLKEGIIVRPMDESHIRVTIGLPTENKRFVIALKKLKDKGIEI